MKVLCGLHRRSKGQIRAPSTRMHAHAHERPPARAGRHAMPPAPNGGPAASVPSRLPMPHSRATTNGACLFERAGQGRCRCTASESAKLREYDIGTERYLAPEMTKNEPCVSAHAD